MLTREQVVREESDRIAALRMERVTDAARTVLATDEGALVLWWIIFEAGGLMKIVGQADEGRRALASALYDLLDRATPGAVEEMALDARKRLTEDNLNIAEAIAKRSGEYAR